LTDVVVTMDAGPKDSTYLPFQLFTPFHSFITVEFGTKEDCEGLICRAQPLTAYNDLENRNEMKGKVAVVSRGVVSFFDKV